MVSNGSDECQVIAEQGKKHSNDHFSVAERKDRMNEIKEHWLAVGRVSKAARKQLIEADCTVLDISSKPPVVLVCLRHESASHNFSENIALTDMGEIEIRVKTLCLYLHFPGDWQIAHSSVTETELVTCDE